MKTFAQVLAELLEFVGSVQVLPDFKTIRVVEIQNQAIPGDEGASIRVKREALFEPKFYEERFEVLMAAKMPWINISCVGLYAQDLIIAIETPKAWKNGSDRVTSINLSGPTRVALQDGWSAKAIVSIEES